MASPAARGLLIGGRRLRVVPFLLLAAGWFESWRWVLCGRWGAGATQNTLWIHPCKLVGALLVCAVLRTRQDRGSASCPTRPGHASGPWRLRFCTAPAPQRFRHFQRPEEERSNSNSKAKAEAAIPAFAFVFAFALAPALGLMRPRPQETVEGRPGGVRRTVGAMDGAIEPPRTGLRRVLRSPPGLPTHVSIKAPNASTSRFRRVHQIPEEDRVDQHPISAMPVLAMRRIISKQDHVALPLR